MDSLSKLSAISTGTNRTQRSAGAIRFVVAPAFVLLLLLCASHAAAQTDYQWQNTTSGGLWSAAGNWSPTGPANGSANTADFATLTLLGNNTAHLDLPETIGSLIFGDQANAFNWTLDNNGSSGNILTLAGAATVTVNNDAASISAVLGGSSGLTVFSSALSTSNGQALNLGGASNAVLAGTLILNPSAVESFSGATTVNGGSLMLDFSNLAGPTNLINGTSVLTLGGGILAVKDNSGAAATSQTFNGTILNPGSSAISVAANGNSNALSMLRRWARSRRTPAAR